MPVVVRDIVFDRPNQVGHAAKRAAANPPACDLGGPALAQIEPRGTGRHTVTVIAGMGSEPGLDLGVGVRAVIVQDEMDGAPLRTEAANWFRNARN